MDIQHDEIKKRFRVEVDGYTAHVAYEIHDGGLDIRHTIVPEEIGGRGIASILVKAAYDYARCHQLKPVATCSYAAIWLKRHPEYEGEIGSDYGGSGTCAL
ncbi:MAG: N-acetyltransferase [Bacteroides sp.]|nr:N-acetyltransferase [Bacteroides sp.]